VIHREDSATTRVLSPAQPHRSYRAAIAVLLTLGSALLGTAILVVLQRQPLVAAAFSGAALLLWLAAAVLQRIGTVQATSAS
jgi:hypothetical protein